MIFFPNDMYGNGYRVSRLSSQLVCMFALLFACTCSSTIRKGWKKYCIYNYIYYLVTLFLNGNLEMVLKKIVWASYHARTISSEIVGKSGNIYGWHSDMRSFTWTYYIEASLWSSILGCPSQHNHFRCNLLILFFQFVIQTDSP